MKDLKKKSSAVLALIESEPNTDHNLIISSIKKSDPCKNIIEFS